MRSLNPNTNSTADTDAQTITIQGNSGSTDTDRLNTDRLNTDRSNTGNNSSPLEALVMDLRQMPETTSLELHNINYSIIIGPAQITGGSGNNNLRADQHPQTINLGAGHDTLHGGGGHDTISSKDGRDRLIGGGGDDLVAGGGHHDTIRGASGNDTLRGGLGNDTLKGGPGNDVLRGGRGADRFQLSAGRDRIRDFKPNQGDRLNIPDRFQITSLQQNDNLILIDNINNLRTTILNSNLDTLIQFQPDLF